MSAASNATAGFLKSPASTNLDEINKVLDAALKSIALVGTVGGIVGVAWKYSEISAAFSRIIRGTGTAADIEMATNAMETGGPPVTEAVHTTIHALHGINEGAAGARLEAIVRRSEPGTT